MSLFGSSKKWERESKAGVEVKAKLDKHVFTYPAARKSYEVGRSEVIRLTGELNAVRQAEGNNSPSYKKLENELRRATLKRDKPLIEYGNAKHDLEVELSQLNHLFIHEELERWDDETKKVKGEKVDEEVPKEKDEPGTFTMGGLHRKLTNLQAIRLFQLKSLEKCNQLRDMTHNSIPEIEAFIKKAEAELRGIDLTPQIIELDAVAFQQDRQDSRKELGKMSSGVLTANGGIEINTGKGESDSEQAASLFKGISPK